MSLFIVIFGMFALFIIVRAIFGESGDSNEFSRGNQAPPLFPPPTDYSAGDVFDDNGLPGHHGSHHHQAGSSSGGGFDSGTTAQGIDGSGSSGGFDSGGFFGGSDGGSSGGGFSGGSDGGASGGM